MSAPTWWDSLRHGGMLLSPARLADTFSEAPAALADWQGERLRDAVTRLTDRGTKLSTSDRGAFVDDVIERVCKLTPANGFQVRSGNAIDAQWTHRALTGEAMRPRRLLEGPHGSRLPVFIDDDARVGSGQGRRTVARAIEWLRAARVPIGLVTNALQWRLVYAGPDWDAWCEWDVELWFAGGSPSEQVTALRALLSPDTLTPTSKGAPPPLVAAVEASRRGQAEVGSQLGERVRQAVELLIRAHAAPLDRLEADGRRVDPRDVYRAATRVVMRLVVLLFAEAREDLQLLAMEVYQRSYSLRGLRDQLDRVQQTDRLRHRAGAWPRVLALFRLMYEGSHHEALTLPRYGGGLFQPGASDGDNAVSRALTCFESIEDAPSDETVRALLDLLCRTRVKVRQGRANTWMPTPVDFSDLSSEYIGILYEGLLDFELRRAPATEPMVFLAVGDEPCLPLPRLEEMSDDALKGLLSKFQKAKREEADEEAEEAEADDGDAKAEDELGEDVANDAIGEIVESDDVAAKTQARALAWARRAVLAAGLVPKPKRKKSGQTDDGDALRDVAARRLLRRVVLPGERFLVRWGGTRKGSGSFYTRPQLAVPLVQRTLRPLAWKPPAGTDGAPDELAADDAWTPRRPNEILALKVCDPAMGSGSFLIASLRYLTDALFASLYHHGAIKSEGDHSRVVLPGGTLSTGDPAEELLPGRPGEARFELRLRAKLKRHLVLRCLYGVDLDPLAVELARVALWVETMDRDLPFEFLDHHLRRGNALVGCWLDRVDDPPLLAWEREGGDAKHDTAVNLTKGERTALLKKHRAKVLLAARDWLSGQSRLRFGDPVPAGLSVLREGLTRSVAALTALPLHQAEERAALWQREVIENAALGEFSARLDTWCALWFWPVDELDLAPMPGNARPTTDTGRELVQRLADEWGFFHWELAFPEVFASEAAGFDAIVGNPPWEIAKPRSQEFFSNIDPLYRTYGKQEALDCQRKLFASVQREETHWIDYSARFNAFANWVRHTGSPFGDGLHNGEKLAFGKAYQGLVREWEQLRARRPVFCDRSHPFLHQGGGDVNTYKLFLEQSHALLRSGGALGMLIPSGIYSDKGTEPLRRLFLDHCRWTTLYAFQNERFVFESIHHSFKIVLLGVLKGGVTSEVQSRFRLGPGDSPEIEEIGSDLLADDGYLAVKRDTISRFSPSTRSLLEVRDRRDFALLERIYDGAVMLGDDDPKGWGISYATEFHMTNDSKLFPTRPKWEADGYRPDEYSRWIKPLRVHGAPGNVEEPGWIALRDGSGWVREEEIEGVALPMYEGRMIDQFDAAAKEWVSGKGRKAVWKEGSWPSKLITPQFLIRRSDVPDHAPRLKVIFMDVTASTNERTFIGTVRGRVACGHKTPVLGAERAKHDLSVAALSALLNSYVFDFFLRRKFAALSLTWSVLAESPTRHFSQSVVSAIASNVARLSLGDSWSNPELLALRGVLHDQVDHRRVALTPAERLRTRAMLDAIVAAAWGLAEDDVRWLLRACDHSIEGANDGSVNREFDPKGFWRAERDRSPELRHAVLTQVAFADLTARVREHGGDHAKGIEDFLTQNNGDGWQLPETLRLADYDLGHDARAKEHQPVVQALGPRWLDWQRQLTPEDSWKQCRRHARNLLGESGFETLERQLSHAAEVDLAQTTVTTTATTATTPNAAMPRTTDLFGNPVLKDLFGNVVEEGKGRGKRKR